VTGRAPRARARAASPERIARRAVAPRQLSCRPVNGRRRFLRDALIGAVGSGVAAARATTAGAAERSRGTLLRGRAAPKRGTGRPGDFYIDYRRHLLYGPKVKPKRGRSPWGSPVPLAGLAGPAGPLGPLGAAGPAGTPGVAGARGYSVLHGVGLPSSQLGQDGDFYIDTAAVQILGPKRSSVWGSPTNLTGPSGAVEIEARLASMVKREQTQAGEGEVLPVLSLLPATPGFAPFQVQSQSFPNPGAGLGTFNHGVWLGWNGGRHAGEQGVVNGKPAIYMGFEDNYFDDLDDKSFGVEWYVGYISPDGQTVGAADLRPFYARVLESDTNTAAKSARVHVDMGSGDDGHFVVYSSPSRPIFYVNPDRVQATRNVLVTGSQIELAPSTGQAVLSLNSPTAPAFAYSLGGARAWTFMASSLGVFEVTDRNDRVHMTLHQHALLPYAQTSFHSSVRIDGGIGFYGATPVPKPTGIAPTAAAIHGALVSVGLIEA
jgi:hypothetical protein